MNTPHKQERIFVEIVVYLLWLALGMTLGAFSILLGAALIFRTNRVPSQAAAIAFVPPVYIVTWLRLKRTGRTFSDIGLSISTNYSAQIITGILIGGCFMVAVFALLATARELTVRPQELNAIALLSLLFSLVTVFVQSGTEEVVFRGYLLNTLARKGRLASILITAALFSFAHFWQGVSLLGWLNIFLFGFFAAQMVFLSKSLWMPIGLHFGWNYFQTQVFGFRLYGSYNSGIFQSLPSASDILNGGAYGPEASIVITLLLLLAVWIAHRLLGTAKYA